MSVQLPYESEILRHDLDNFSIVTASEEALTDHLEQLFGAFKIMVSKVAIYENLTPKLKVRIEELLNMINETKNALASTK